MEVAPTNVPIPVEATSVHADVAMNFGGEDEAPGSGVSSVINTDAGRLCQG